MKDQPTDRNRWLEDLHQVPGDALTLAIFICRQQELVDAGQGFLELFDLSLLLCRNDVEGGEVLLDINSQA